MPLATLTPQAAGSTAIVFTVSADRIRTWNRARAEREARYATHEIHLQIPKLEYLGPGDASFTLSIRLDRDRGIEVGDELALLRTYCDTGEVLGFVHGGTYLTDVVIKSIGEEWLRTDSDGAITAAQVDLRLQEYV